jgi:hypothetical protein
MIRQINGVVFEIAAVMTNQQWRQYERHRSKQAARHLAARAIVALRANFPVERIVVVDAGERASGTTCDWNKPEDRIGTI